MDPFPREWIAPHSHLPVIQNVSLPQVPHISPRMIIDKKKTPILLYGSVGNLRSDLEMLLSGNGAGNHTLEKRVLWRRRLSGQKKIGGKFGIKSPKFAKIWPKDGLKWPKIA